MNYSFFYYINFLKVFSSPFCIENRILANRSSIPLIFSHFPSGRLTIKAKCPMELHSFPMDRQSCPLILGSCKYLYSLSEFHPSSRKWKDKIFPSIFSYLNISADGGRVEIETENWLEVCIKLLKKVYSKISPLHLFNLPT